MAKTKKKRKAYYEVYEVETVESVVWGCANFRYARQLAAKYNKNRPKEMRSCVRFVVRRAK